MSSDDINRYINLLSEDFKQLLCEINNAAQLFQVAISSGVFNNDIKIYNYCFISIGSCSRLNTLDINNKEHHRSIFRENAIFYGNMKSVLEILHEIAENNKSLSN